MIDKNYTGKIEDLIMNASHIAVIPSRLTGVDSYCAAAGLYYLIKALEKRVDFLYQGKVPDEVKELVPSEEISSDASQRDLVVEINYADTGATKVHFQTEKDILRINVGPISKDFDYENRVKPTIVGLDFDLIFTLGVQNLRDLGSVYTSLESKFDAAQIINIDNTVQNENFGVKNIVDKEAGNLSILVFKHAAEWGLTPDVNAAKSILKGITLAQSGR